jgi:hypothetical protein
LVSYHIPHKYFDKSTLPIIPFLKSYIALKYNFKLQSGEDKTIYNFIMNNWKEIYSSDHTVAFQKLKNLVSVDTYNFAIKLYNEYKNKYKI